MKTKIVLILIATVLSLHTDGQVRRLGGLRRGLRPSLAPENLLEPLVPIDEALNLVKEGKGKGFYQLAIRYASGNELPQDKNAAYRMLCKACDLNYPNAILVEGMCDEGSLRESSSGWSSPSTYTYCGVSFSKGTGEYDLLTNEVAFARVMKKYEKARDLGALAATNQITALNKRLADFYQAEKDRQAKIDAAEENNRRLSVILGEDMRKVVSENANAGGAPKLSGLEIARARRDARLAKERDDAEQKRQAAEQAQKEREQEKRDREMAAAERKEQHALLMQLGEEIQRQREERQRQREERLAEREEELSKCQAALKEIIGYEMGQKIAGELKSGSKKVELEKPYRYFGSCELSYVDGCLWSIHMRFYSGGRYTYKSLETEADAIRKDLTKRFGIVFKDHSGEKSGWRFSVSCTREARGAICFDIADYVLQEKLHARLSEKNETGKKELPVFDEISSESADLYRKSSSFPSDATRK